MLASDWSTCNILVIGQVEPKDDPDGGNSLPTTPSGDPACAGYEGQWTEDQTTGMCYQVLETELSWDEAREECRYRGGWRRDGDLASINTFQEQIFMQSESYFQIIMTVYFQLS